jgi:hypothetical protein
MAKTKQQKTIDCFENFFDKRLNEPNIADFKNYMKNKYAENQMKLNSSNPDEVKEAQRFFDNRPANFSNYNRLVNMITNFYSEGSAKIKSTGAEAFDKYLRQDLYDYIQHRVDKELMKKANVQNPDQLYYIKAGRLDGLHTGTEYTDFFSRDYESRTTISASIIRDSNGKIIDTGFDMFIRSVADYLADVPVGLLIVCTKSIYVANRS